MLMKPYNVLLHLPSVYKRLFFIDSEETFHVDHVINKYGNHYTGLSSLYRKCCIIFCQVCILCVAVFLSSISYMLHYFVKSITYMLHYFCQVYILNVALYLSSLYLICCVIYYIIQEK